MAMTSHMSTTTLVLLVLATLGIGLRTIANRGENITHQRTHSHVHEDRMSAADVQTNLLEEVEVAFGKGSASSRVEQAVSTKNVGYGWTPAIRDEELANQVVAIVTSSPRPEDADGSSLKVLQEVVLSVRRILGPSTTVTVAFDGVAPNLGKDSDEVRNNYHRKISDFRGWVATQTSNPVEIWINDAWTHQANMQKRVLDYVKSKGRMKPFLFFTQDDSEVVGEVDTPFILRTMASDPEVDYVRIYWCNDCSKGEVWKGQKYVLCTTPHSSERLVRTWMYADRPHFMTTNFFMDNVYPNIPIDAKKTPEQLMQNAFGREGPLWLYGRAGHMRHDANRMQGSFGIRGFGNTPDARNANAKPETPYCPCMS